MAGATDTISIGMIGCGGNARGHMKRLLNMPGVKIVALVDPSEAAIAKTLDTFPELKGVPVFSNHQEMLDKCKPDAVEISTPHTLHCDQIVDALDAGAHVLTEKPMVCSVAEAKRVLRKRDETGLIVGVSYQRHFQGPFVYCRNRILSGDLGPVNFIAAYQSQNWYRNRMARHDWRSKPELSGGGQLNDSGSHLLDIVLWMTDLKPDVVFAFQDNLQAQVDILTAMSVRFDTGALANFSVVGHAVNWLEHITIACEEGTLLIADGMVREWAGEQMRQVPAQEMPPSSDPDTNFIAAIRGEDTVRAPAECGLEVARLTDAAWASAKRGQPVAVSEVDVPA